MESTMTHVREVDVTQEDAIAVAQSLAQKNRTSVLAIDLDKLKVPPGVVGDWVDAFYSSYKTLFRGSVPPSVAVYVESLNPEAMLTLRMTGAVVFERSFEGNQDMQTPADLETMLQRDEEEELKIEPVQREPGELSSKDQQHLNSYPAGVTPQALQQLLDKINT